MSFTENLYLKRMIQQLHEENLKLKSLINEAFSPFEPPHFDDTRRIPAIIGREDPIAKMHRRFSMRGDLPTNFIPSSITNDLHPANPLRVDDADTGSAAHPGEEGAVYIPTNPFPVRGYTPAKERSQEHPKPYEPMPYPRTTRGNPSKRI